MPRHTALPATLPPRLIGREAAAAYCAVSASFFDQLVDKGLMPAPKLIGDRRRAWDVRALDLAIDRLPIDGEASQADDTWADVDAA